MRFSIIIPVYNVEEYIGKCLDTVMHQSFSDYEVIVVNDETPDNSMAIVEEYAKAFPGKIQMIHQKNTRQGGARNNGVSRAQGEYLLFVDSDDYVSRDMLKTLDERLKEQPCDVLAFQHVTVTPEGEEIPEYYDGTLQPGVYHPQEDKKIVFLSCNPWGKVFRRECYIQSGMQFPEKLLYEDAVTRLVYAMASTVVLCEDRLYYYVQSSNSSMRRNISEKMLDILTVTDIVIDNFRKNGIYETFREPLDCALIYGILYVLDLINNTQKDHPIQIPMADYLRTHFPEYRDNPYVGQTLARALDYLVGHDFKKYHYRILVSSRIKERILCNPVVAKLNALRKGL